MKKFIVCLIVGALLMTMCIGALAAGESGIDNVQVESAYSSVVKVTPATDRATVEYSAAKSGSDYVIIVMTDTTGVPTEENIAYINELRATSSTVSFTAFPKTLKSGATYYVYMSSNAAGSLATDITSLVRVASFGYTAAYILGDVNEDGSISATDALFVLQAAAGKRTLSENQSLAADTNKDGSISATDALFILQAAAGKRTLS
jgi:hypothetical protein